jgi:diadenylate cyclase
MAEKQIGALICLEREVSLNTYVDGGIKLDSQITSELMVTLFYPGTPLHDGAAILRDDRLIAAGCLFPLSENPVVSRGLGTRHRAGIGVTEQSDALSIIVSEETGEISFAVRGTITRGLSPEELERTLRQIYVERKEPQGAVA